MSLLDVSLLVVSRVVSVIDLMVSVPILLVLPPAPPPVLGSVPSMVAVSLALLSESPLLHAARDKKITPAIRSFFIDLFEVEAHKIIAILRFRQ